MRCGSAPTVSPPTATWRIKSAPILWRFWPIITRSRFYVAAPQTTLDRHCPNGAAIPIEQRGGGSDRSGGQLRRGTVGADGAAVYNPAFDVTPAGLISGWVLDSGVVTPAQVAAGAFAPDNG